MAISLLLHICLGRSLYIVCTTLHWPSPSPHLFTPHNPLYVAFEQFSLRPAYHHFGFLIVTFKPFRSSAFFRFQIICFKLPQFCSREQGYVYSLFRSIAGSPSSFSSPDFPNCSSSRESASVYTAYLRSHFSVSQLNTLRRRAIGYLSQLRRATCPEESHSFFCSPFSPTKLFAAASNLSSSTATGPDKVAYPMLKHLLRSGVDFLLHIFNLSWSSHCFPSIWKTSIIPSTR